MVGRRIYADADGNLPAMQSGDYGKAKDGAWWIFPPGFRLGTIRHHQVEEHEDGTITVSPSILYAPFQNEPGWHGYLERGVWRTC